MTGAPIRVLYVDDDEALARLVQKALRRRGKDVHWVSTHDAAMAALQDGGVDVMALDHYLAGTTGLDLLNRLSALPQPPPVVYVTGSTEMDVALMALKGGAGDFVPKTVGDDFLVLLETALDQAVEKARLRAAKEAAETEVRVARDRAELLLAEVNHRVANSLALVASLVTMQAKSVSDQAAKDVLAETQARIQAVALVHRRLYDSSDVSMVDLEEYLAGLLDHLRTAMHADGHGASLTYDLTPLKLATDASIRLGIIVTEWVTNAFKYAYPDDPGDIRVALSATGDGRVRLTVTDHGVGRTPDGTIQGSGLGTRIVKAMAMALDARAGYLDCDDGTTAELTFTTRLN